MGRGGAEEGQRESRGGAVGRGGGVKNERREGDKGVTKG